MIATIFFGVPGHATIEPPSLEPPAEAAPVLHLPFQCGETWMAGTHAGHGGRAVDWNLTGPGNADRGKPVLAGAAGIAHVGLEGYAGYGNVVIVEHAAGWSSLYAHLQDITVAEGQSVRAATIVGHVGSTGNVTGVHLHHEQLLYGVRQPLVLAGEPIVPSLSSRAAPYTSRNCVSRAEVRQARVWKALTSY